jgi:hypothetical protein
MGSASATGTVSSIPLSGLTDAGSYGFSGFTSPPGPGVDAQWQFLSLASDHADVCQDAGGTFRDSEITFRLNLFGYADNPADAPVYPPSGDLPLTMTANQSVTTSDGVHRTCKPYVMKAKNGRAGTDHAATSGTVTVTAWDASGVTASWDLYFGSDHTTGSLSAPWCGTPPA